MNPARNRAELGKRYACFRCNTKFYDLNREIAACPECGADQAEAPVKDIRAILAASKGRKRPLDDDDSDGDDAIGDDDYESDDDDDLLGGYDDDDDDGDGDGDGDDDEEMEVEEDDD